MRWRECCCLSSCIERTRSFMVCHIRNDRDPAVNIKRGGGLREIMDKRRTKVFRDKLLDRREGLVGQVQAAELYSRERDAEATQDPADRAANAYTKELLVSMSDNDRQLLNLIDEALERIETAGYGKCVHCGEALPEKRLDAVPWARHCVRCQDLQERGLLGDDED